MCLILSVLERINILLVENKGLTGAAGGRELLSDSEPRYGVDVIGFNSEPLKSKVPEKSISFLHLGERLLKLVLPSTVVWMTFWGFLVASQ